jgi:hypothetical protein
VSKPLLIKPKSKVFKAFNIVVSVIAVAVAKAVVRAVYLDPLYYKKLL